jgi:hypothetical protein
MTLVALPTPALAQSVDGNAIEEASAESEKVPPPDPSVEQPFGAVTLDPIGFVFFGPQLSAEVMLGRVGLGLSARWFSGGYLSHAMFPRDGEDLVFSYGVAAHVRYYFSGIGGFYGGAALERLQVRIEDNKTQLEAWESTWWVPQLEVGYRYPVGAFFVGGGAACGYAIRGATKTIDLSGGMDPLGSVDTDNTIYGSLVGDVGVFF